MGRSRNSNNNKRYYNEKMKTTKPRNQFDKKDNWFKRNWRKLLAGVCALLIVAFAGVTIYFKDLFNPKNLFPDPTVPVDPDEYNDLLSQADMSFLENTLTFLILGIDEDSTRSTWGSYRTDTMMVCTINFDTNAITLTSIPRDSYVKLYPQGVGRVNTAFTYGGGISGDGFADSMKTVSNLMGGIPINYYVAVNMDGLYTIAKALEPIPVDVEVSYIHYSVAGAPETPCGTQHQVGMQNLDAFHFMSYIRQRKGDSDIHRAGRQQRALIAMVQKMKDTNIIAAAPAFYETYKNSIYTNLSVQQIAALAVYALGIDFNAVETHILPGNYLNMKVNNRTISYWGVDMMKWKALIKEIYGIDITVDMTMDVGVIKSNISSEQEAYMTAVKNADSLIKQSEDFLKESSDYLTSAEVSKLRAAIDSCEDAVLSGTKEEINDTASKLRSALTTAKNAAASRPSPIVTPTPPSATPSQGD